MLVLIMGLYLEKVITRPDDQIEDLGIARPSSAVKEVTEGYTRWHNNYNITQARKNFPIYLKTNPSDLQVYDVINSPYGKMAKLKPPRSVGSFDAFGRKIGRPDIFSSEAIKERAQQRKVFAAKINKILGLSSPAKGTAAILRASGWSEVDIRDTINLMHAKTRAKSKKRAARIKAVTVAAVAVTGGILFGGKIIKGVKYIKGKVFGKVAEQAAVSGGAQAAPTSLIQSAAGKLISSGGGGLITTAGKVIAIGSKAYALANEMKEKKEAEKAQKEAEKGAEAEARALSEFDFDFPFDTELEPAAFRQIAPAYQPVAIRAPRREVVSEESEKITAEKVLTYGALALLALKLAKAV